MFKMAKQMRKERKDIVGSKYVSERRESYGKVEKLFFFLAKRDQ